MRFRPTRSALLLVVAILLLVLIAAGRLWLIPARFSHDPNEGWNALQSVRALGGGPLYPAPNGLTGNNYPPLSFYLIGYAARLFGDAIVIGRLVALAALVAVAGCIAVIVRRFTSPGNSAPAIAAILFLAINLTLFRGYVAMDDPQWLAHAVMMIGLCLIVPRRAAISPGTVATVSAALLFVCAGLVKHNLFGLPAAVTLWLLIHHRRAAMVWLAAGIAAIGIAAWACAYAYGPDFFADLLAADRGYSWSRMISQSAVFVAVTLPLLIACGRLLRLRGSDPRLDLLLLAVALCLVIGIIEGAGQGVDCNAQFEAAIALCIAGAVAFGLRHRARDRLVREPLVWSVVPLLALMPVTLQTEWHEFADRTSEQAYWATLTTRIAMVDGPVACQMPAACYWAGKPLGVDFFLYGQHAVRHGDASALIAALRSRRFAAIELEEDSEGTAPLSRIVEARYRTAWGDDDGHRILVPR
jgi:hypothetical protein